MSLAKDKMSRKENFSKIVQSGYPQLAPNGSPSAPIPEIFISNDVTEDLAEKK